MIPSWSHRNKAFFVSLLYLLVIYFSHDVEAAKKGQKGRAAADVSTTTPAPALNSDPAVDIFENDKIDPFVGNKKWALFLRKVKVLSTKAVDLMKNLTSTVPSLWSAANPSYNENRVGYLRNYSMEFTRTTSVPLADFFEEVHAELERKAVYTRVNAAVGLTTIAACMDLAKTNPTNMKDKMRLKWIEINSLAVTIHHVFDRLNHVFSFGGLSEIEEVVKVEYPSWITRSILNETGNTYEGMTVDNLSEYINTEIDAFGEKNHLIRGLERLLRVELQGWDPRKTDRNIYCYGNNKYGVILDEFDILTEAAMFLSLADVKYALMKMIQEVNKELKIRMEAENSLDASKSQSAEVDFNTRFEQIAKEMVARIEKKTKIVEAKDISPSDVIRGPLIFKCDTPPPPSRPGGPIISSPDCPPGVYIQKNVLFMNGTAVALPTDSTLNVVTLPDGTPVNCVRIVKRLVDGNGTIYPLPVCPENVQGCQEMSVPVLVDPFGAPIYKPNTVFSDTEQWGKFTGVSPLGNGTEPPQDLQAGSTINGTRGYIDGRTPSINNDTTAHFEGAFSGYLESELVLNPEQSCAGTCTDYRRPTETCNNKTANCDLLRRSHCENGEDCMKKSKCPSRARRCIRAAPKVSICNGDESGGKPYEWLNFDGRQVGAGGCGAGNSSNNSTELVDPTKTSCNSSVMVARERWQMETGVILNTPQYCELCLCICEDPSSKAAHFQFAIVKSGVVKDVGYVVTGVKFARIGNVFSLVTERGKLLSNGNIDENTLVWDEFKQESLDGSTELVPLGTGPAAFKKMSLDIVTGEVNEVVTLIRVAAVDGVLGLDVFFKKLDENGRLNPNAIDEQRAPFPAPTIPKAKVEMNEVCSPAFQRGPSQPFNIPNNGEFIEFDATSLEKDAGQAVVPFFDLQPVHSYFPGRRPLTSVGVLYKSKQGSGGFLSPIISVWENQYL